MKPSAFIKLARLAEAFARAAEDLLFPVACVRCGAADALVCEECMPFIARPRVKRLRKGPLRTIVGLLDYHDPFAKKIIAQFKYKGHTALVRELAPLLAALIKREIGEALVLVPAPADFWRRLERGFHHTELIARAVGQAGGWPMLTQLKKRTPTRSQTELDRNQRLANLKNMFVWRGGSLAGKTVVVIDDVTTTGATLAEAARAIRRAKPKTIYGAVLAVD